MKQNFNDCLTRVLKDEGGYSNDPNDSGGPTNYGITLGDFRHYISPTGTASDVKNMSINDAKAIYRQRYWNACNCDALPSGCDYSVFDYAVNSGTSRALKSLGKFPKLSGVALIDAINDERVAFLKDIGVGKNSKFLKGWLSRVDRVRNYSKVLYGKKDNVSGPTAGAGTVAAGIGLSQYFQQHEVAIIIGALVMAFIVGAAIHVYRNRSSL